MFRTAKPLSSVPLSHPYPTAREHPSRWVRAQTSIGQGSIFPLNSLFSNTSSISRPENDSATERRTIGPQQRWLIHSRPTAAANRCTSSIPHVSAQGRTWNGTASPGHLACNALGRRARNATRPTWLSASTGAALVIVSAKWSDEGERSHGFDVRWGWSMAAAARFDGDRRYKLSFWHVGLGKTQVVEPET